MNKVPVITIDGPGGTGKGTVSRLLAHHLRWHLLDSGVLYRALAMAAINHKIAVINEQVLESLAENLDLKFLIVDRGASPQIFLANENITESIRTEECGNIASKIAILPKVRAALLERQRAFRKPPGLVADGRDMGSVIFPDAELKIFLIASREQRALRRQRQLKDKGIHVNLSTLLDELNERDIRDSQRAIAPLQAAEKAITIDTTSMTVDQVLLSILKEAKKQRVAIEEV